EDAGFRRLLGAALGEGAVFEGDGARGTVEPVGAPARGLDALPTEVSRAEQSNSSVRFGQRAMLKLFRRLEHGENPDVEIGTFLTTRTDFEHTPAVLGVVRYRDSAGASYVTGMLSRFVVGARDGWAIALDAARAALRGDGAPDAFAGEAGRIGTVTRELHDALASSPDTPGFRNDPVALGDVEDWERAATRTVEDAMALLADRAATLPTAHRAMARAIAGRRAAALERLEAVSAEVRKILDAPNARLRKTRHHGDYHLGQLLRGEKGVWFVVDFEGEPSRPLAERRGMSSPLRDVAGMLRSFAYAAATAAAEHGGLGIDAKTEIAAAHWEREMRAAFLSGYRSGASRGCFEHSAAESVRVGTMHTDQSDLNAPLLSPRAAASGASWALDRGASVRRAGTEFRVWAPNARTVEVVASNRRFPLEPAGGGLFEGVVANLVAGDDYAYSLGGGPPLPDPVSRHQPDGV